MEGMKSQEELDAWAPAIAHVGLRKLSGSAPKTVLRVLEICSGCCSVSAAARKEAEDFGVDAVEVFSVDGKPSTVFALSTGFLCTLKISKVTWMDICLFDHFRPGCMYISLNKCDT